MKCTCPNIMLGTERTEHKNWNPDCEEHSWESEWYNGPEQTLERHIQYERTAVLQRLAKMKREGTITAEEAKEQIAGLE